MTILDDELTVLRDICSASEGPYSVKILIEPDNVTGIQIIRVVTEIDVTVKRLTIFSCEVFQT